MNLERSSGILLHITSLPGKFGIGTLGNEAYEFANNIKKAGLKYWQILPIGPVNPAMGFSPYSSASTFAGNYLFISLEKIKQDFLPDLNIDKVTFEEDHFIPFDKVISHKQLVLKQAAELFFKQQNDQHIAAYNTFCNNHEFWLNDFAIFSTLAQINTTDNWLEWDVTVTREDKKQLADFQEKFKDEINYYKFKQFIFFNQWQKLKTYCNSLDIKLIGDIPIYISLESADAWSHPDILQLDREQKPMSVAGVPPDYFSSTGQRWGSPIYKWFKTKNKLFKPTLEWWFKRIAHLHKYIDIIRIDHFRGFESYWSIPVDEPTAINGTWKTGPGIAFFEELEKKLGELPLIAEDLGIITPEVEKLRDDLRLPGMKILQFAFDYNSENLYLPHNITNQNCILYTGTHDNNTTNGWFYGDEVDEHRQKYILNYLGTDSIDDFHWQLLKLAFRSVANCVIFPAQDIIGFGGEFRMNTPGTTTDNWHWKLTKKCITEKALNRLKELGQLYSRI